MTPAISIVIPTAGRVQFLRQAIDSAIASATLRSCEVIVVPNGPSAAWRPILRTYETEPRVRVQAIEAADANAARNAGLALARGEFLRFLDDDDTLAPGACDLQCDVLDRTGAEACSGSVSITDEHGAELRRMPQQHDSDLVQAMVLPRRVCLPTAHVFRRAALGARRWQEGLAREQDTEWMYGLCELREWHWHAVPGVVGTWRQHGHGRTSKTITTHERGHDTLARLRRLHAALLAQDRMTPARQRAFGEALWDLAHRHFPRQPRFWAGVVRESRVMAAGQPMRAPFEGRLLRAMDPLWLEWVLLPARRVLAALRGRPHNPDSKS